jgi:hypothetical protein
MDWCSPPAARSEWNGLKVFRGNGSLLLDEETRLIEAETSN